MLTPLNHAEKAIRLCAAADCIRLEIGAPLSASRRPIFDNEVAAARESLGDDKAFDRAWQEGRAMTLEQAVAYALEETDE